MTWAAGAVAHAYADRNGCACGGCTAFRQHLPAPRHETEMGVSSLVTQMVLKYASEYASEPRSHAVQTGTDPGAVGALTCTC
jgi:hypothetical protein